MFAEYIDDSFAYFQELGWKAKMSLADMCRDMWNWQTKNPKGFAGNQKSSVSVTCNVVDHDLNKTKYGNNFWQCKYQENK